MREELYLIDHMIMIIITTIILIINNNNKNKSDNFKDPYLSLQIEKTKFN